jgi:hypothetical protein
MLAADVATGAGSPLADGATAVGGAEADAVGAPVIAAPESVSETAAEEPVGALSVTPP